MIEQEVQEVQQVIEQVKDVWVVVVVLKDGTLGFTGVYYTSHEADASAVLTRRLLWRSPGTVSVSRGLLFPPEGEPEVGE